MYKTQNMKKIISFLAFAAIIAVLPAKAQTKAGKVINTVEHKTAKTATVVGAKVTDKKLKNVKGPNGETCYVDKYDKKYYVSKRGHRVFLKK